MNKNAPQPDPAAVRSLSAGGSLGPAVDRVGVTRGVIDPAQAARIVARVLDWRTAPPRLVDGLLARSAAKVTMTATASPLTASLTARPGRAEPAMGIPALGEVTRSTLAAPPAGGTAGASVAASAWVVAPGFRPESGADSLLAVDRSTELEPSRDRILALPSDRLVQRVRAGAGVVDRPAQSGELVNSALARQVSQRQLSSRLIARAGSSALGIAPGGAMNDRAGPGADLASTRAVNLTALAGAWPRGVSATDSATGIATSTFHVVRDPLASIAARAAPPGTEIGRSIEPRLVPRPAPPESGPGATSAGGEAVPGPAPSGRPDADRALNRPQVSRPTGPPAPGPSAGEAALAPVSPSGVESSLSTMAVRVVRRRVAPEAGAIPVATDRSLAAEIIRTSAGVGREALAVPMASATSIARAPTVDSISVHPEQFALDPLWPRNESNAGLLPRANRVTPSARLISAELTSPGSVAREMIFRRPEALRDRSPVASLVQPMPVTTVARTATPGSGFESNETNSPGGANSLDAPAPAFDMTRLVEAVCSQLRRDLAVLRERRGQSR